MDSTRTIRRGLLALAHLTMMAALASPAVAQTPSAQPPAPGTDPNPGNLTLTGSLDSVSTYMFRGIRQHSTGMAFWPAADLGASLYSGKGSLKNIGVNVGTWNSLHTGDTGVDGPTGKLWYESDFYTTLALVFGGGASVNTTYTAITSPNNAFTTVKEIAFRLSVDDSRSLGRASLKPYAFVSFEFDTSPGVGQADGGSKAGRYLELGVAPGYTGSKVSLNVPVKLGMSLANYYELNAGTPDAPEYVDHAFGYLSIAWLVTAPLGKTSSFGAWNLHGGVEVQVLGETTKSFNGGEGHKVIVSGGIGFSY